MSRHLAGSADLRHSGARRAGDTLRCAEPPTPNPDKYDDEHLDTYLYVADADALHAEHEQKGVDFTRGLGNMPWNSREFVVKDCDGRLLAFGANV